MANGGPFGNPLSTGIALNFEVDMTPYRQMMQDNLDFAKNQAAERKKGQKEFQDILKNITLDTGKIHERYKKDAMNEYASTINDVMAMQKAGNVGGVHERIGKYNSGMDSYVNATTDFNNYKKSKGDNTFRSEAAIAAMDNVEGVSNEQLMKDYQNDVGYSNGLFNFTVIDRPDVIGYGNKVLQGVPQQYVKDDKGEIVATETFGPKGTRLYETSIKNPENFIKETSAWLLGSAGGNRLLMEQYGMTADQLDEVDKDTGRQRLDLAAEGYIRNTFAPKLYGEKEKDPYNPRVVDKDPPETSTSIQLSGGDTSLTVQSQKASSEMKVKAIDKAFSSLPTEEEDGVESTDYSLKGFEGSAVQRRLEAMGFTTRTEPIPFPGVTDNLYVTKGDKTAKYDLDENVYTNLRSFVDENAGDVLEDNPLEIINLPRDAQHVISQTKATEAQNKINLLPIKNAIVVGADGMDYMALTNNIDLRGQVSEVYDYIDIEFDNIDKLKGGEEGDPGYSFYNAVSGDHINRRRGRKRYYKIIPGGSIEAGTSTDREFNDVIGKQTGKGTGYEASRTGAIEYILVEETPELKSRFESNYKLNPAALNPFD